MKKEITRLMSVAAASAMALGCTACSGSTTENASGEFSPKLDTEKSVTLEIAGFFGNFEALDQVENAFNEIYPNVTFSYEQNGNSDMDEYLKNNSYVDIFMTTDDNVRFPGLTDKYAGNHCADLSGDVDVSAIREDMLDICYVDGKLVRIPMSQNLCGYVVNVSLL